MILYQSKKQLRMIQPTSFSSFLLTKCNNKQKKKKRKKTFNTQHASLEGFFSECFHNLTYKLI